MVDKPASQPGVPCSAHHGQCKMDSNGGHCTKDQGHDGNHHCHACGMDF
jgi:hypothetical protein